MREREAELLRRVTTAANDTSSTQDLLPRSLTDIGETMGWAGARAWMTGDDDLRLEAWSSWMSDGEEGQDWLTDSDPTQAALDAARSVAPAATRLETDRWPAGLHGAVTIPIIADGATAAVLEFFTTALVELDPATTTLLTSLGRQLGSVVERERIRRELDRRAAELERSNAALERFAYVASHDLQEPLRKIVGFAELLERNLGPTLEGRDRDHLGHVVGSARRMQLLIRGLLAYSRADRAVSEPTDVNLDELVEQVLSTLSWGIEESGARIHVGPLPRVHGDADQIMEVVANLLTNALKYTRDGHPPRIRVTAGEQDGEPTQIRVADEGIGIDEQHRDTVFDVFRRLHGPQSYSGSGIGLAIAKLFTEANGGRLWVTGNEPYGTIFHLTPAAPDGDDLDMTTRPIEILLVDDDPLDIELTMGQLRDAKLRNHVTAASNGEEALAILRHEDGHEDAPYPDLILLDLNMPRMNGHEFLAAIKDDPELATIPVVVVTTSDEDADIIESYRLHANAYVTKPVGLEQMSKVVRAIEGFWFEVVRLPDRDRIG